MGLTLGGGPPPAADDDAADDDDSAGDDDDDTGDDDTGDDDTGDDDTGDDDTGDDDSSGDDDDSAGQPDEDADGDGYPDDIDCNDQDAAVHPGASELCDSIDNDCDGATDESEADDAPTWYEDSDGDGYGLDSSSQRSCGQPHGFTAHSGDCDDSNPSYHPGAAEADCTDPNDYNCDGSVGYADVDGDGEAACEDCNDADIAVNSAATESCNGSDDDCDGQVDEAGATGEATWYLDADSDGYGRAATSTLACTAPPGYVADSNDCDDLEPLAYPGNGEVCDEIDNNCDGSIDEGAAAPGTWYADADGDGFGNATSSVSACSAPFGTVADFSDCDDLDASAFPGGTEICDGADNNCDTQVDEGVLTSFYADLDGDGYGDPGTPITACLEPAGASPNDLDCDDGQSSVHPGAVEVCDGLDNDCNSSVDVGALDATTWYLDDDGDGYGAPLTGSPSCAAPSGTVSNDSDCDDSDSGNFPGNAETCDGEDDDCDGAIDEGYDHDGDGVTTCGVDGTTGSSDDDCDDGDGANFPGNAESCDSQDNDCDGVADNGCLATAALELHLDASDPASYSGSGGTWLDTSGGNHDANMWGNVNYSSDGGGSFSFDGGAFDVPSWSGFQSAGEITLEVWAKLRSHRSYNNGIITNYAGGSGKMNWMWSDASGGQSLHNNGMKGSTYSSGGLYQPNQWYHFALRYRDNVGYEFFINGALVHTQAAGGNLGGSPANNIGIGAREDHVEACDALISIARIYTRALTDAELTGNFDLQKARFGY